MKAIMCINVILYKLSGQSSTPSLGPDSVPLGCVRPEARDIALRQTQGTIARLLQDGDHPPPRKRKYATKNLMNLCYHSIILKPSCPESCTEPPIYILHIQIVAQLMLTHVHVCAVCRVCASLSPFLTSSIPLPIWIPITTTCIIFIVMALHATDLCL